MRIFKEFWYDNIELTEYDTSSKDYKKLQELICRNEQISLLSILFIDMYTESL